MFFKNSRQTYALHLMNSLLNKFYYIISNVSNRKNLHRVQLMTESYPDRQYYSKEAMSPMYTRGMARLPNQSGGNQVEFQKSLKSIKQSGACTQVGLKLLP